jgi:hypothetical protein
MSEHQSYTEVNVGDIILTERDLAGESAHVVVAITPYLSAAEIAPEGSDIPIIAPGSVDGPVRRIGTIAIGNLAELLQPAFAGRMSKEQIQAYLDEQHSQGPIPWEELPK